MALPIHSEAELRHRQYNGDGERGRRSIKILKCMKSEPLFSLYNILFLLYVYTSSLILEFSVLCRRVRERGEDRECAPPPTPALLSLLSLTSPSPLYLFTPSPLYFTIISKVKNFPFPPLLHSSLCVLCCAALAQHTRPLSPPLLCLRIRSRYQNTNSSLKFKKYEGMDVPSDWLHSTRTLIRMHYIDRTPFFKTA